MNGNREKSRECDQISNEEMKKRLEVRNGNKLLRSQRTDIKKGFLQGDHILQLALQQGDTSHDGT